MTRVANCVYSLPVYLWMNHIYNYQLTYRIILISQRRVFSPKPSAFPCWKHLIIVATYSALILELMAAFQFGYHLSNFLECHGVLTCMWDPATCVIKHNHNCFDENGSRSGSQEPHYSFLNHSFLGHFLILQFSKIRQTRISKISNCSVYH